MALKPCRECGQSISTHATTCPYCGKRRRREVSLRGCLLLVGLFILLLILGSIGRDKPDHTGAAIQSAEDGRMGRQIACERAMRQRLKAPTTAKFDGWSESQTGKVRYLLRANVTSQNSFGAMLTGLGVCEIVGDTITDVRIASP